MERVKERSEYTYRCRICQSENLHTKMPQTDLPVTVLGHRGESEDTVYTPLALDSGAYLTLDDGSTLLLDRDITVSRGYQTYADTMYTATSISFVAAAGSVAGKLVDSDLKFGDQHIKSNMSITVVTTSGTNDGNYIIADRGVSRGEILVGSTYSLTTEDAATAGTVIIKRIIFTPNIITGCYFCGSLNSR